MRHRVGDREEYPQVSVVAIGNLENPTDVVIYYNRYVDYAMHRVRLLRHHKIEPYIVFDGGPLPAKKGTEKERKQKREENLARGKAFEQQGKHSQARECFIKCIDVTPQMAYQFIKALRAESVSYVVAPYEADAQLAYLERTGAVDAILTEDSDLLVFGCQNVLFKLDAVANTVVSISRKDFGSVTASSTDTNGISLLGWSDVQFRAMTILSGCDYLPSIPGIGLKTACSLLRKWKTAEQVVKALALEGKKPIPPGYWKLFQLAEKCFLHQRVYCPNAERLVHLTAVGDDWNVDFDAYVGKYVFLICWIDIRILMIPSSDLDPLLAKKIALGDADPATYMPMQDINKGFIPRALKPLVHVSNSPIKSLKSKGKMREIPPTPRTRAQPTGGIMNFFGWHLTFFAITFLLMLPQAPTPSSLLDPYRRPPYQCPQLSSPISQARPVGNARWPKSWTRIWTARRKRARATPRSALPNPSSSLPVYSADTATALLWLVPRGRTCGTRRTFRWMSRTMSTL